MFHKLAAGFSGLILAFSLLIPIVHTQAAAVNLITNPSVEQSSNAQPTGWNQGKWGTNTTAFTYKTNDGHTGTSSLLISMTSHTSGDAKWYFTPVTVQSNSQYTYSDFYKANVATEIDAMYTSTSGAVSYAYLSSATASASNWKQLSTTFTTPANTSTVTIFHLINKVGSLQTDDYSLMQGSGSITPTPPTVSITSPAPGSTISGSQTVFATASDTIGLTGVQFSIDGSNYGSMVLTAPYSISVDTTKLANGAHVIGATATNTSKLTTSVSESVNVQNSITPTPPSVAITAPSSGATVSGTTQSFSANASDAVAVTSVQFKLDGANLGNAISSTPYTLSWDTTKTSNGSHSISAVATNSAGLSTTATITVSVQNVVTPPGTPNLVANPSFETSSDGISPDNWYKSTWGSNTAALTYLNSGHTGSHSVKTEITKYTSGAANWYYNDLPVSGGKTFLFSNWYQSNVDTEVDAEVVMSDGSTQYLWLGNVFANTNWAKYSTAFTPPAGAVKVSVYQLLAKVGYIINDDVSLSEYTPTPFNRGIVSVSFDDGWTNQYQNAVPVLQQDNIPATFNIISGELTDQPMYMSGNQVKSLQAAGDEIASHSVTHPDLTTVSQSQLVAEMSNSQTTLQNVLGVPVTDFAYPYGAYNLNTISVGKQYYQSQRSVNAGLNSKDNLDLTQLKIEEVDSNISQAQVDGWINAAIAQKTWLILVYHEIATTPSAPDDSLYTTQPADFSAEMAYLKQSGVATETVHQAINEILPQL